MKMPLSAFALMAVAPLGAVEIRLQVLDDAKRPLPGVAIEAAFGNTGPRDDVTIRRVTDQDGRFVAQGTAVYRMHVKARLAGHYDVDCLDLDKTKDHDLTVIMREIRRPIPLYADMCRLVAHDRNNPPPIPFVEGTYAYDLEVGELLPPHGRGRVADVQVYSRVWFLGWRLSEEKLKEEAAWMRRAGLPEGGLRLQYGRWRSEQVVTFPGKDAGFVQLSPPDFQPCSGLKHPHEAPLEGYQPEMRGGAETDIPTGYSSSRPTNGYFLRLRVKHDAQGRIVSAHYAKIFGVIAYNQSGGVLFPYIFNPTPNDRNLEFELGQNLFKGKKQLLFDPYR